jgi:flagellar motor protein MotB
MIVAEDAAPGSAEEGENYFVSMTDMMIGILFIFIIMLMVFAMNFRTSTDDQEDALRVAREVARKLDDLRGQVHDEIAALDQADRTKRQLLEDIKDQLQAEGLNVEIDQASGVLRLTEDAVRFGASNPVLDENAQRNVAKIAKVLEHVLPAYVECRIIEAQTACGEKARSTVETVFIEGHTDSTGVPDPEERDRRNWQLSSERAINTYRQMVAVAPLLRSFRNRDAKEIISVSGYSSTRAIDVAENREAWAANRRIDLRFVMDVDSRGGLEEILGLTDEMQRQIRRIEQASDN